MLRFARWYPLFALGLDNAMAVTPVSLLCGFLGSGKTTLLARALESPVLANALIIVNEFGEVSIDHLIVADLAENILELRNGCLCCTIRGDLAMTLRDLYHQRQLGDVKPFNHVVVETSGLADPIPLVHTLMANPPLMRAYQLDTVVCVVDAVHGAATMLEHETAANQVALADLIVMSKSDVATATELAAAGAQINASNPAAEIHVAVQGEIDIGVVFGRQLFDPSVRIGDIDQWLAANCDHNHGSEYTTHAIVHEGTLSLAGTSVFLNHVVNEQRDHILRIKGLAGFNERDGAPALLHAVQDKFYPVNWLEDWPSADRSSRLVFIGRGLDVDWLNTKFRSLCI